MKITTVRKYLLYMFLMFLTVVLVVGGCTQKAAQPPAKQPSQPAVQPAPAPAPTPAPAPAPAPVPAPKPSVKTVYITAQGFDPVWTIIKAGDTVVWINNDTVPHWPASAVHPTHNVYPEPGGCIGSKFDACHEMVHGEQWNFTFNVKGTWSYHDHLKQTIRGRLEVD